jgi:predicted branched-subunit amino acid permease
LLTLAGLIVISNARYLLYGAALRPWLLQMPRAYTFLSLFMLGDTNWALSMDRHAKGERDTGFVVGSGLAMYVAWVIGTAAGAAFVPNDQLSHTAALDFAIVALCAALAAGAWRPWMQPSVLAAGASAAVCLAWGLLALAPLACGLVGAWVAMLRRREARDELGGHVIAPRDERSSIRMPPRRVSPCPIH